MFTKRILRVFLIAAVTLLALNISPGVAEQLSFQPLMSPEVDPTDMGTAFTYQGRLMNGAAPANGVYDFRFRLYDDASAGVQIGGTIFLDDYTVSNGLFMADLDYGASAFTGFERWLEIAVKPDAIPGYTSLTPRQKINPAPYATFARTIYRKTLVVKPVTLAGNEQMNGQVLMDTLGGISDASASNPYLVKIEPGVYDLASKHLDLVPYVDLEGSGKGVTIITAKGREVPDDATVIGASNAEIRLLTIQSIGIEPGIHQYAYATALYIKPDMVQELMHVFLQASNGSTYSRGLYVDGLRNTNGTPDPSDDTFTPAFAYLTAVEIEAFYDASLPVGTTPIVEGILNDDTSYVYTIDSVIGFSGGLGGYGIFNDNAFASLDTTQVYGKSDVDQESAGIKNIYEFSGVTIRNSRIANSGISTGTALVYGLFNAMSGPVQVFDSIISADGVDANVRGISHGGTPAGQLALNNVKVEALGSNISNYGVHIENTPLIIRDSHLFATGGKLAVGLDIYDSSAPYGEVTQTVIIGMGADPSGAPIPMSNTNFGVRIYSDGVYDFLRDTIQTQPEDPGTGIPDGGIGLMNDGAEVTLENSTINDKNDPAFNGIAHIYHEVTNNRLWVDNSEIYSCYEPMCSTIQVITIGSPGMTPVSVSSSLLWGGPVMPGFPFLTCMWVTDENYNGYGWPAMVDTGGDTVMPSFICP